MEAGIGRIRMRRISDASAGSLMPFIEDAIELRQHRPHGRLARIRSG